MTGVLLQGFDCDSVRRPRLFFEAHQEFRVRVFFPRMLHGTSGWIVARVAAGPMGP